MSRAQDASLDPVISAFLAIRNDHIEPVDPTTLADATATALHQWSKVDDATWTTCMAPTAKRKAPREAEGFYPIVDAFLCAGYRDKVPEVRRDMVNVAITAMAASLGGKNQWMAKPPEESLGDDDSPDSSARPAMRRYHQAGAEVISVPNLSTETAKRLAALLVDAADTHASIILDLRGNGGGLLDEVTAVADLFLDKAIVGSTVGRIPTDKWVIRSQNGQAAKSATLVVVTDENTGAGAELLASALQDNRRALIVGKRTLGAGTVETMLPVKNAGYLRLTTSRIQRADGRWLSEAPAIPDCETNLEGSALIDLAVAVARTGRTACSTTPTGDPTP